MRATWKQVTLGVTLAAASAAASAQQAPTSGDVRSTLPAPGTGTGTVTAPSVDLGQRADPGIAAGGPAIRVERFEVEGNTVFSDAELLAEIADYVGRELTLLEIYGVSDRLTDFYRNQGYSLASVTIPAQKISTGTVRLVVLEGRIADVGVEGAEIYDPDYVASHLDEVVPGELLRGDALNREMLLLNDLPGLEARALVQPGDELGTSDLVVRASDKRFSGRVQVDNHGRNTIGRFRTTGDLNIHNPTGLGDNVQATVLIAEGSRLDYGRLGYDVALNKRGTRGGVSASRYVFDVDPEAAGLADPTTGSRTLIAGDGATYRAELVHPFVRSTKRDVFVGLAVSRDESDQRTINETGGVETSRVDDPADEVALTLYEVSASLRETHADNSLTHASVVYTTNLKNNPDGTRDGAQKGRIEAGLSHLRRLFGQWTLFARASGVVSMDPLMNFQRFRIGGQGSVRGFQSAELSGDQGIFMSLQVNRPVQLGENVNASVRGYWDAGVVHRMAKSRAVNGETPRESLTSAGVGVTVNYAERYTLELDAATPLNSRPVSDGRPAGRIWGSLSARF